MITQIQLRVKVNDTFITTELGFQKDKIIIKSISHLGSGGRRELAALNNIMGRQ
jgi:hypothetical protein